MKKLIGFIGLMLITSGAFGFGAEFEHVAVSSDVVVSTSSWTLVPASNARYRKAIVLDNYATNSANMLWTITESALSPSSTSYGATMTPAEAPVTYKLGDSVYFWFLSLHTASENLYYQELK